MNDNTSDIQPQPRGRRNDAASGPTQTTSRRSGGAFFVFWEAAMCHVGDAAARRRIDMNNGPVEINFRVESERAKRLRAAAAAAARFH